MRPPFQVPVRDILRGMTSDRRVAGNIEALRELPARPARNGPWPEALHPDIVRVAKEVLGVEQLYVHQSLAAELSLSGRHVATVAGTAAGKSLGYLLPILDSLIRDPDARAILIFPTKALAHDQLAVLKAWNRALPDAALRPASFDGDTPRGARSKVRQRARIIVTNPDMLHAGILPHHPSWAHVFAGLTDVVVDEMHVYRGVFGSHVANVLRRLQRVARFHGAADSERRALAREEAEEGFGRSPANALDRLSGDGPDWDHLVDPERDAKGANPEPAGRSDAGNDGPPQPAASYGPGRPRFHLTSATIANPGELARRLVGAPVAVVEDDGAPRGKRSFVFYNPPVVDEALNLRRSAILDTEMLARRFLEAGVQTIVFARTRQTAELIVRYLSEGLTRKGLGEAAHSAGASLLRRGRDGTGDSRPSRGLEDEGHGDSPLIRGYRGGYRAEERRAIEADLREGRLRGVVATNALELGIDIGELDACVMSGYPGTIASTWQQAGRAGRRGGESVAVLVASPGPLDQYVIRHPDYFFERSPEHARIDPDNLLILLDHLRCAAFELPFGPEEAARPFGADPDSPIPGEDAHAGSPDLQGDGSSAADDGDDAEGLDGSGFEGDEDFIPTVRTTLPPPPVVREMLEVLTAQGVLREAGGNWYWLAEAYPAGEVSLRSAGAQAVAIVRPVETQHGASSSGSARAGASPSDDEEEAFDVLGTVEHSSAPLMVHPGAVYLHDGETYEVSELDLESGRARVHRTDGSVYTRASSHVDIQPIRVFDERRVPGARAFHGELEVASRVTGYRRLRFRTHETVGWGDVDLPEQRHVAGGYWFTLDDETVEGLKKIGRWKHDPLTDRGPNWRQQAERARRRDERRCRMCDAPERDGRAHDVHHIRPFRSFGWVKGVNENYRAANELDNLITLCKACHRVAERALGLHGGLSGLGHAMGHIAPLFLMCDGRDLGVKTESNAPWCKAPVVAVYERASAGLGFGEALYGLHERLVRAAHELIRDCPCDIGCPGCVGPAGEQGPDAKGHALAVLKALGGLET